MNNTVTLTIIIPVYNVENYILNTLNSIKEQTCNDYEIIIVNDGSTDNSLTTIEKFIFENKNIKISLINKKNGGVSSARNQGLEFANGRYVLFLDGDDYINAALVEEVSKIIMNINPDIIVYGYNRVKEDKSIHYNYFKNNRFPTCIEAGVNVLTNVVKDKDIKICINSAVYNRDFLLKNSLLYTIGCHSGEDTEFIFKALTLAKEVFFIHKVLSYYLIREGSITNSYNIKRFHSIYAIHRVINYVNKNTPASIREAINKGLEDIIIRRYIVDFIFCLGYKINNNIAKKEAIASLNSEIDNLYPNLRIQVYELMKNHRGINTKRKFKIKLFRFSPIIYYNLGSIKKHLCKLLKKRQGESVVHNNENVRL